MFTLLRIFSVYIKILFGSTKALAGQIKIGEVINKYKMRRGKHKTAYFKDHLSNSYHRVSPSPLYSQVSAPFIVQIIFLALRTGLSSQSTSDALGVNIYLGIL